MAPQGHLADLVEAVLDGRLDEDHQNDFKTDLHREKAGRRKANIGLAKDLAAMAVDGGRIWIGVHGHDNDEGVDPEVTPVDLTALAERVEDIARSIPRPPVLVRFDEVTREDGRGVLVVEVPWSAEAPHMVEGSYWGRGEKRNEKMANATVRAIWEQRARTTRTAADVVVNEHMPDPIGQWFDGGGRLPKMQEGEPDQWDAARLIVVARPEVSRSRIALLQAADGNLGGWLAARTSPPGGAWTSGTLDSLWWRRTAMLRPMPRTGSVGMAGEPLSADGRSLARTPTDFYDAIDVDVTEGGRVRIYRGNLARGGVLSSQEWLGFIYHGLRLAREVRDSAGLWSNWVVGFALYDVYGVSPRSYLHPHRTPPTLGQPRYVAAQVVPAARLDELEDLVESLCSELGRALDTSPRLRDVQFWD